MDKEAEGWACGGMERRCAGVIDAAGLARGEMGEDLIDELRGVSMHAMTRNVPPHTPRRGRERPSVGGHQAGLRRPGDGNGDGNDMTIRGEDGMICHLRSRLRVWIMPTRNIVLTDHQAGLVARLVASGRYQNASEVMREGLRLVERQESEDELRLEAMRKAADTGIADIAAGRFRTFDTADALEGHLSALSAEALADLSSNADTEQ